MFFKKKKLIEAQAKTIDQLNEQIKNQQQQLEIVKAELESYKNREHAISRAITDAAETASRIVLDAQKESDEIHDSAQQEYISSQKKSEALVQEAYENARDIIKDAEKTSEKKIQETDAAVSAYVGLLNQFNESMKEQARQAEENVKKLSDYYVRLNNALPELFAEVPLMNPSREKTEENSLPDPEGDPAQLMRNIYTIQKRYLPHEDLPDRTSMPPEDEPEEEAGKKETASEEEPELEAKPLPRFSAEEGTVVKVSDIVTEEEDLGTINTDEFIAKTAELGNHPFSEIK